MAITHSYDLNGVTSGPTSAEINNFINAYKYVFPVKFINASAPSNMYAHVVGSNSPIRVVSTKGVFAYESDGEMFRLSASGVVADTGDVFDLTVRTYLTTDMGTPNTADILFDFKAIGTKLATPDAGWKRIDDKDPAIQRIGTWSLDSNASFWGGSSYYTTAEGSKITFKFKGTKIRLICANNSAYADSVPIKIDGITESFNISQFSSTSTYLNLEYEKTGLVDGIHEVEITVPAGNKYVHIDAIDIDDAGYMPIPIGAVLTSPESGWRRYENGSTQIVTNGSVKRDPATGSFSGHSGGNMNYGNCSFSFTFEGTKLRIIGSSNPVAGYSTRVPLTIDGVSYTYSNIPTNNAVNSCLLFEIQGLPDGRHDVVIGDNVELINLDAIDINDTGRLVTRVGEALLNPDDGWSRYDDRGRVTWSADGKESNSTAFIGSNTSIMEIPYPYDGRENFIRFRFVGSQVRIISAKSVNRSNGIVISIDGVKERYGEQDTTTKYKVLVYEKVGLPWGEHEVIISMDGATSAGATGTKMTFGVDAIDVDATGHVLTAVGYPLRTPDPGWKRYDDTDPIFIYEGFSWGFSDSASYNGAVAGSDSTVSPNYFTFKFRGTKLRIITSIAGGYSDKIAVTIDGSTEYFSAYTSKSMERCVLTYEKVGLTDDTHEVRVEVITKNPATAGFDFRFDAIDINEEGRAYHPQEVLNARDLVIGSRIRANYCGAYPNTSGFISELGKETKPFITHKANSSAVVYDGDFYLIMVDENRGEKVLMADRNVAYLPWNYLNYHGEANISGSKFKEYTSTVPVFTSNSPVRAGGYTYTISSSNNVNPNYPAYKAFGRTAVNNMDCVIFSGTSSGWLQIDMGRPVPVTRYHIYGRNGSSSESPKVWYVEASNTGDFAGEQVVIDRRSLGNNVVGRRTFYARGNTTGAEYRYYRLVIHSSWGTTNVAVGMWRLEWEDPEASIEDAILRIPTGGVSANSLSEWDKYIGSDVDWHWSGLWSWTTSSGYTNSASMVVRGRDSQYAQGQAVVTGSYGYRPMLIIKRVKGGIKFDGGLERGQISTESSKLVGQLSSDISLIGYRIILNDTQLYPPADFTPMETSPVDVSFSFNRDMLKPGQNSIRLEAVSDDGFVSRFNFALVFTDEGPNITASMDGPNFTAVIDDIENDAVAYRVLLNGVQIFPEDLLIEYSDVQTSPVTFKRTLRSSEVNYGVDNTIEVIAKDKFDVVGIATLTFTGDYYGVLFVNENGDYYSTDEGIILELLDMGILMAGQTSYTVPVKVINKHSFKIQNIVLSIDESLVQQGVNVTLSKTDAPYIAEETLVYDNVTLGIGDSFIFYVQVESGTKADAGTAQWDILVSADPVV